MIILKIMMTNTEVKEFVQHVENMRGIAADEDALYSYLEAARSQYGEDSLMTEWITTEYCRLVKA